MLNLWPVLITGVLLAILSCWRQRARLRRNNSRRRAEEPNNKNELRKSLDELINFLSRHEMFRWVSHLRQVRAELGSAATEQGALSRLGDMFGGMGSLNDLVFDTVEAKQECDKLLDAVFRDMKIYNGTQEHRALWKKLEEEHKDDGLPPRIKHAFRKS